MKKFQLTNKKKKILLFSSLSLLTLATTPLLASCVKDSIRQPDLNEVPDNNNQFTSKIIQDILDKNGGGIIKAADLVDLTGIPDNAFTPFIKAQITHIELSNNIKFIGSNVFKNLTKLAVLDMSKSRITTPLASDFLIGSTSSLVELKFPVADATVNANFVPATPTIIYSKIVDLSFPLAWTPGTITVDFMNFKIAFPFVKKITAPGAAKIVLTAIWPEGSDVIISYIN